MKRRETYEKKHIDDIHTSCRGKERNHNQQKEEEIEREQEIVIIIKKNITLNKCIEKKEAKCGKLPFQLQR